MEWTTKSDIAEQLLRLWRGGRILASIVSGEELFPKTLRFSAPRSHEFAAKLPQIQAWADELAAQSKNARGVGYTIGYRRVNHRVLGANDVPCSITIETLDDALYIIGKKREAAAFVAMLSMTERELPQLIAFLYCRPIAALEHSAEWGRILSVCKWMLDNPRPGIYTREIGLPGVDSKFIEANRGVLSSLFDMLLPASAVDSSYAHGKNFALRYGFRTAPSAVRLRLPLGCALFPDCVSDVSLTSEELARVDIPCSRVFVTENLTNFLTLPRNSDTLIIWGAGYGFENMKDALWLAEKDIFYWGDIDTHGFAILSEFREHFPNARSFLMDEATLLAHIDMCVTENAPARYVPQNLTYGERELFAALLDNKYGERLRLEQERININRVRAALNGQTRANPALC